MRGRRLTQLAIDRLKLAPGERVQIPDGTVPGLELRASWGGTKRFWLRYRFQGEQFRCRLGEHPSMSLADARKAARAVLAQLDQGLNPLAVAETKGTVREVAEQWLARDQAHNRTAAEVRRILEREVLPQWGDRPIEAVRKRDVLALIDELADRAPIRANRVLAHIRRLFNWAAGRDLIEANPAQFVERPTPERSRDRVIDDAELASVWHACESLGPFGAGVRLLICTGARRAEVFEATWAEVDLDGAAIRLPAERSKVAEGRAIPLNRLAVSILGTLPRRADHAFVISISGRRPVGNVSKLKRKLDARASVAPWRLHDLRRSVATSLQRLNVRLEVIEAVLGHVSGTRAGVVGVYQRHRWEQEARAALDDWSTHLEKITNK